MTQTASDLVNRTHADSNAADGLRTVLDYADAFARRHLGPTDADIESMLGSLGFADLEELTNATIPEDIQLDHELDIPNPRGEHEFLNGLATIASKNKVYRSCIGMGYTATVTPPVILRNVLENPGWYTQYTPYQAEIAQGRLEALLNFQTMIDRFPHRLKQTHAFTLVLNLGVHLSIPLQPDTASQMVHGQEMVFPCIVDYLK